MSESGDPGSEVVSKNLAQLEAEFSDLDAKFQNLRSDFENYLPKSNRVEAYKVLATLNNVEETSFYTRNNTLFILEGALIAGATSVLAKLLDPNQQDAASILWVVAALSLAGAMFSVSWWVMVRRSTFIANKIASQLQAMERDLFPGKFQVFEVFEKGIDKGTCFKGVKLTSVWTFVAIAFVGMWLMLASWATWDKWHGPSRSGDASSATPAPVRGASSSSAGAGGK